MSVYSNYDHLHPIRWSNLSGYDKSRISKKTEAVLTAATQCPNKLITYETINKTGLEHLYHFLVDIWNDNHTGSVEVLEKGVIYRP